MPGEPLRSEDGASDKAGPGPVLGACAIPERQTLTNDCTLLITVIAAKEKCGCCD